MLEEVNAPAVLDLYCGNGTMFKEAYDGKVKNYFGIDKEKIFDNNLCVLEDNRRWVAKNDISGYNFFDLDAYGCPWLLMLKMGKN